MTTTTGPTPLVDLETLREHLDRDQVRTRVREAVVSTADRAVSGAPGELLFEDPHGDCHVKYGHLTSEPCFVVKVATGFPGNDTLGLPATGGVVLMLSKASGLLMAILDDGGWLTAWRTGAVASLVSRALSPPDPRLIAVIGTGLQAELQATWHADLFPEVPIVVAGRDARRAHQLADRLVESGLSVQTAAVADAVAPADVIVTATSARAPLFSADLVTPGTHITAVGADSPGKQELDPHLLARAEIIVTDNHQQCLDGGELGGAVRAGLVENSVDVALASALAGSAATRQPSAITVADLTGLTVQDLAIASYFRERLGLAT